MRIILCMTIHKGIIILQEPDIYRYMRQLYQTVMQRNEINFFRSNILIFTKYFKRREDIRVRIDP